MTAERHELHELVDELPEDQVAVVLADVRRRLARPANKGRAPEFYGIVEGSDLSKDLATSTEHYLGGSRASEAQTAAIKAALGDLDGTDAAAVSSLTGLDADELGDLGGLPR
jgi:hypothetical protein